MCWKCKKDISQYSISMRDTCSFCGEDLHSCRNCVFYQPGAHYDCHENVDELVKDKEKANFCDYFKVKREFEGDKSSADSAKKIQDAKDAFNSLFSI